MSVIIKLFFIIVIIVFPQWCFAFSVSPQAQDIELLPGGSTQSSVIIENDSEESANYHLDLYNVIIGRDITDLSFTKFTSSVDLNLTAPSEGVFVLSKSSGIATIQIVATNDAKPGVYIYAVSAEETKKENDGIVVSPALVSLLFVTVEGEMEEAVEWTQFSAGKRLYWSLPIVFSYTIKNSGERIVQPSGAITIESWTGREVGMIDVNKQKYRTPGNHTRSYEALWGIESDSLLDNVNLFFRQFAVGSYTARLAVQPWTGGEPYNQEISFTVIPWLHILVLIIVIIVLLVSIKLKRR